MVISGVAFEWMDQPSRTRRDTVSVSMMVVPSRSTLMVGMTWMGKENIVSSKIYPSFGIRFSLIRVGPETNVSTAERLSRVGSMSPHLFLNVKS